MASTLAPYHFLQNNHERFENETINYLDIPALKIGFEYIESIGMSRINERTGSMMKYLVSSLKALKHSNGRNQIEMFGDTNRKNRESTLILTFKNQDSSKIPFELIENKANEQKISIRSGCFCNPGLDEINNCLTEEELTKYFESRTSGDYWDMIKFINKMRGATRISVGIATNKNDLDVFISFVQRSKDKNVSYKALLN